MSFILYATFSSARASAAIGGLWPVELPFQILFLGDLTLPELLLAELPLLQEIIQQAIAKLTAMCFSGKSGSVVSVTS